MKGLPGGSDGKESTGNAGDPSSIPGSGRSPGEGTGNPLHGLDWRNPLENPQKEETGGLQPMGSQRVRYNWATSLSFTFIKGSKYAFIIARVHQFSSITQSRPILRHHGLQHARPPCPSPTPGVYSNSCPLSQWCHPTISSSVVPFSFQQQGLFQWVSSLHEVAKGLVSASTSVLPMNTQDWFPLGWTGWISL